MDVIIIGAGPAGLFAADKLSRETDHTITVLEMGKESTKRRCSTQSHNMCTQCDPCDIYAGIGGAGALSDGKLNITPRIGGDPDSIHHSYQEIAEYIEFVDETFLKYGADKHIFGVNKDDLNSLRRKASASGIEFISGMQRHMGSDKTPLIIDQFYKELKSRGVTFVTKTKIEQIEHQGGKFFARAENKTSASVSSFPPPSTNRWSRLCTMPSSSSIPRPMTTWCARSAPIHGGL
jgi:uncharacterized FAD-dependent dehydrogenase